MRKLVIIGLSLLMLFLFSPLAGAQEEEAAIYTVTIHYTVTNNGQYQAENARMIIFLFDNVSGWAEQTVLSESIDGATLLSEIESTDDNRWVRISLGDLNPGESKTATVIQTLKIKPVTFSVDPTTVSDSFPQELLDNFTSSVDGLFESGHPTIQALAQQLTENIDNPYYMARQIFDFVLEDPENEQDLTYERQLVDHGALWGLQSGAGDCTEFSNLFIALARAVGIPAKAVAGYGYLTIYNPTAGASIDIGQLGHAYSIFYLPNYGWVPADAVWPQYIGSFGEMDHRHIVGGTTGGEGIVKDGEILWPSVGTILDPRTTQIAGQETDVYFHPPSGTITPKILVDVDLQASSQIENDQLTLTATVKNLGRSPASGLTAEIEANPAYFDVITSPQQKDSLASGEQWVTSFVVQLKGGAYENRHVFTSMVSYDSSYGGISETFLARGNVSVQIPAKPTGPQQGYDIIPYVLVGVLVAVVAVVAVVLARR